MNTDYIQQQVEPDKGLVGFYTIPQNCINVEGFLQDRRKLAQQLYDATYGADIDFSWLHIDKAKDSLGLVKFLGKNKLDAIKLCQSISGEISNKDFETVLAHLTLRDITKDDINKTNLDYINSAMDKLGYK